MLQRMLMSFFAFYFVATGTAQQAEVRRENATLSGTFISGNKFLDDGEDNGGKLFCLGYIAGTADQLTTEREAHETLKEPGNSHICLPGGVSLQQLTDVALKYVRNHPETRHLSASYSIIMAWGESFGCQETK